MLFNSFSFLVFFPAVVVLYYLLKERWKTALLLLASCIFYMAFVPKYVLILFALITLDFFLAQIIERNTGRARLICLWISIAGNVGMLAWFKYFNFLNANVALLAHFLHWNYPLILLSFALPLGLSFHVFQSLSYVIEVYRGKFQAEKNYLRYALYVMFFPQLVAGPIERPAHLLPQFKKEHPFVEANAVEGLERMLWGFFKKLVIADNIAPIVDHIYASGTSDGPILILGSILFVYQLYCDFSGYSDIAVGTAKVLGYEITENFNRPFAARSINEFWRRWHISLSSWLRDYLYYPLYFSIKPGFRSLLVPIYTSTLVTFVLIGLWHGANWTFAIMGALFGIYIIIGSVTEVWRKRLWSWTRLSRVPTLHYMLQVVITFLLATFAFIFFRAPSISEAWHIVLNLGSGLGKLLDIRYVWHDLFGPPALTTSISKIAFASTLFAIVIMEGVQYLQEKEKTMSPWTTWRVPLRTLWAYGLIFSILWFGNLGPAPFIYFKF